MRALRPAAPERLAWVRPEGVPQDGFAAARERLAPWLARGGAGPVYEAKRRAIYRVDDPVLGPVAVKEVRSGGWLRELCFRRCEHPALRELRVGAAFAARGGATPAWLAAAIEGDALRRCRVFLCMRWIDGARSLGTHLRELGPAPGEAAIAAVCEPLLAAARLGLVHGRHSGDNLLVSGRADRVEVRVIDFAHASLRPGFDPEGFAGDAGRIAAGLVILRHATEATAARLLDALADAWPDAATRGGARERLEAAFRQVTAG